MQYQCHIISISEMYMIFGKFSSSSRQIQKICFVMKNCVFIDLNMKKDNTSPLLLQGRQNSMYYFFLYSWAHRTKMAARLLTAAFKIFGRN